MTIRDRLFALQDSEYQLFQCKLMPGVDASGVIGVRTPALRALAKELAGTAEAEAFIATLPHDYYDEMNLHGFLLYHERDYDRLIAELDRFLPYVDNWATCDLMRPKALKKMAETDPERVLRDIRRWMASDKLYTCRFGMEMLMSFYLDERFRTTYLDEVCAIRSEEYYLRMMQAWFVATALAKQYDATLPYLIEGKMERWTHNKAIQKAIESYRITPEQKEELRKLKRA